MRARQNLDGLQRIDMACCSIRSKSPKYKLHSVIPREKRMYYKRPINKNHSHSCVNDCEAVRSCALDPHELGVAMAQLAVRCDGNGQYNRDRFRDHF